jgi:hypothetical protein
MRESSRQNKNRIYKNYDSKLSVYLALRFAMPIGTTDLIIK